MDTKEKGKKKKIILTVMVVFLGFLVLAVGGGLTWEVLNLQSKFGWMTVVNGESFRGQTEAEAAKHMAEQIAKKKIVLYEGDQEACTLTFEEAGYSLDQKQAQSDLKKIIHKQKVRIPMLHEKVNYTVKEKVVRDDTAFAAALRADRFSGERVAAVDAVLAYDSEQGQFAITPEVPGTEIEEQALQDYISAAMEEQLKKEEIPDQIAIHMDDSIYKKADVTADQEEIQNQMTALNDQLGLYHNTNITYDFGETKEVLTGDMICSWLTIEGTTISVPEDPVRQYVTDMAAKYNTIYNDRYFAPTGGGEKVKLEHNEYGYRIDQDAEFAQLYQEICSGTSTEREPVYSKRGYKRNGTDDLAGCYIEVSIDRQHLWMYKDGNLVTETDIVSGKPVDGRATYKGAWPIAYKASPYTLSSSFYGYEVHVNYWMPFVYGQGLHDLASRTAYGGDIYLTNGTHGCVNVPLDQIKIIYDAAEQGYPVILY